MEIAGRFRPLLQEEDVSLEGAYTRFRDTANAVTEEIVG